MSTNLAPVGALKIKEAAKYLGGVSHITIRRLIKRGLIKPNRALRHVLIPVSGVGQILAALKNLSASLPSKRALAQSDVPYVVFDIFDNLLKDTAFDPDKERSVAVATAMILAPFVDCMIFRADAIVNYHAVGYGERISRIHHTHRVSRTLSIIYY